MIRIGFLLLAIISNHCFADGVIKLDTGSAKGTVRQDVEQFLGLPYAAPPVQQLRWAPPQKPKKWQGVRDASVLPTRCPQSQKGLATGVDHEDCLYLNLYRPAQKSKASRAIYLYVHGGGAVAGSASDVDGSELAKQGDIIVITINYRLGALGFMNSELIAKDAVNSKVGNYALMDVKAALEWTKRNARAFGGDPGKITLGGESAGGTVLCPLMTSPDAQGLFRSAIISSDDCLHDIDTLEQAHNRARELAQKLNCNDVQCLRDKASSEIVAAGGFAAPTTEPETAYDLIAQKKWRPIPVLVGANREEGRIAGPSFKHVDREKFEAWLNTLVMPSQKEKILKRYGDLYAQEKNPYPYITSELITDSGMRGLGGCSSMQLAKNIASQSPVFFYEFADPNAPFAVADFNFQFGSPHSAEIPYVWPGTAQPRSAQFTPEQKRLSEQMIRYWTNFIKYNNPNGEGLPLWSSLAETQQYIELSPQRSGEKGVVDYEQYHRCDLWYAMPWIMDRGEPQ